MTTWTLAQIGQAQSLRTEIEVRDVARRRPHLVRWAESDLATRLRDAAHPFAIELDPRDIEVRWKHVDARPWERIYGTARWNPRTKEVELRGGHLDGQRHAILRVGEPLRVARPASPPWATDCDEMSPSATLTGVVDTYTLRGWRETERVWVYEPA